MGLETYRSKRDFKHTKEPRGGVAVKQKKAGGGTAHDGFSFVVQEHHARPAPKTAAQKKMLAGAKARLPSFLEPQLATLTDTAPEGDDWLHEIKLDGYRMLARCEGSSVRLLSRRGLDWTSRMPSLAAELARLSLDDALLDGEVVVLDEGVSSFQRLQNALAEQRDRECIYYAFDLIHLGTSDLRGLPLQERKSLLADTLGKANLRAGRVRLSEHVIGSGPEFFRNACKLGLEGIISKRSDAPYRAGRGQSWLKVKCVKRQELVIGGYTKPQGARAHFGALLLGVYEDKQLKYAGRVGTGFNERSLRDLAKKMAPLVQKMPPFTNPPRGADARDVRWLEPKLVAEIAFVERTKEGSVRHASFQGLREDKPSDEVSDEKVVKRPRSASKKGAKQQVPTIGKVRLTHPDRVLYPDQGITKAELALYYAQVAEPMLVHLANRPLMLVRCPEGQGSDCFHQKHPLLGASAAVKRVAIDQQNGKSRANMMVNDAEGLIALVQMGALEVHAWGCHADDIEHPDQLTFDLDPDEGLPWPAVVEAARTLRARLEALKLDVFLKTTGGKGLHLVIPIKPKATWDEAKAFCRAVADAMVRDEPDKYVANISKAKRKGKTLIDYLRNGRGATAVCAYSTRARPGAPIAAPIVWDELTDELRPDQFTLRNFDVRLPALHDDPWRGFGERRSVLPARRQ